MAEKKYTTTEKEYLAIVWAVCRLCHFLQGAPFILEADHKPLLLLESAKSSHARSQRLERWSLELRTHEFQIIHRPGTSNIPADVLSRFPVSLVAMEASLSPSQISQAQCEDPVLSTVILRLETGNDKPTTSHQWNKFPLCCYKQIWAQLILHETILCRKVKSPTMQEEKLLIVVPRSLQHQFLAVAHDKAGHQSHSFLKSPTG